MKTMMEYMPPCVVKVLTGWPCPWCGMQRGTMALLEGNFVESLTMFPPLLPMIALVIVLIVSLKFDFAYRLVLLYGAYGLVFFSLIVNFITKILAL